MNEPNEPPVSLIVTNDGRYAVRFNRDFGVTFHKDFYMLCSHEAPAKTLYNFFMEIEQGKKHFS